MASRSESNAMGTAAADGCPPVRALIRVATRFAWSTVLWLGHLGHADSAGVAMGLAGQSAHEDALAIDRIVFRGSVVVELAPHDVGVPCLKPEMFLPISSTTRRSTSGKGKTRHPELGLLEKLLFPLEESIGRHRLDESGLIVGVLHDGQPRGDAALGQDDVGDSQNDLQEAEVLDCPVVDLRPPDACPGR